MHTHHMGTTSAGRIVTNGPAFVEPVNMFPNLAFKLHLQACRPGRLIAHDTRRPFGLDQGLLEW
jgi:hypothetical protein